MVGCYINCSLHNYMGNLVKLPINVIMLLLNVGIVLTTFLHFFTELFCFN